MAKGKWINNNKLQQSLSGLISLQTSYINYNINLLNSQLYLISLVWFPYNSFLRFVSPTKFVTNCILLLYFDLYLEIQCNKNIRDWVNTSRGLQALFFTVTKSRIWKHCAATNLCVARDTKPQNPRLLNHRCRL